MRESDFREKSLVIFGCGYVGSAYAMRALERGMRVTALTRNAAKAERLRQMGISVTVCDLQSDEWHSRIDPRQDYALNCVSGGGGTVEDYRASYVEGQRSILRWAKAGSVGTLVYTSSTAVYPQGGDQVVDESAPNADLSDTGAVLLEAEKTLDGPPAGVGRAFVLRLAGIYGPGRHYLLNQLREGRGEFAGTGEIRLNLVHLDDILTAVDHAFAAPSGVAGGVYNVADNQPHLKREVVAWLAHKTGAEMPRFNPDLLSPRQRKRGRTGQLPSRRISNAKIKHELGWVPGYPSFKEGYASILRQS